MTYANYLDSNENHDNCFCGHTGASEQYFTINQPVLSEKNIISYVFHEIYVLVFAKIDVRYFSFRHSQSKYGRLIELKLHCDTATEGCVSNDFFRHSLDDSPASSLFTLHYLT